MRESKPQTRGEELDTQAVATGSPAAAVERHPLLPFLPPNGRVLFLGSFPPPRKRWCMDFFYPNWINDHWRIEGLVWFGDKDYFVDNEHRTFRLPLIVDFLNEQGIGFYDTATAVRRLADNASDKFLEVVERTDIAALVARMPQLQAIATTGEKAAQTICEAIGVATVPQVGGFVEVGVNQRHLRLYRLPSSSRAYPLSLTRKAAAYQQMFSDIFPENPSFPIN